MSTPPITFRRNVVEPVGCIKSAWELVKDQYWLFVGMCAIGLMISAAVPIVLVGPIMCGLYLSFFKMLRREPIEFGTLFKGFDYFGPSLVATALHLIPIFAIIVPAYLLFYVGFVLSMVTQDPNNPNPAAFLGVFALFMLFWLVMFIVIIFISIGFSFVYPLITDRKLAGLEAIKWSFRAAFANFWRLLGMLLLTGLLTIAGAAVCYVGMFLVFPIQYGALAMAYDQVFGVAARSEEDLRPPPPPTFEV